jgi:oxygen-independent coproporphyrinogen-3 oxidase
VGVNQLSFSIAFGSGPHTQSSGSRLDLHQHHADSALLCLPAEEYMNTLSTSTRLSDQALVNKYAGSGPRYTSYPTAPQFSDAFPFQDYLAEQARQRTSNQSDLSLYVHVPFCADICYYCACNKIVTREGGASRRYLDKLHREIVLQSELHGSSRPIRQLHWGGGTPTYLDHAELTELMHDLASHFQLLDQGHREYSIEIDPRTTDGKCIALLKGLGFNRISLGIQDFDPLVQKSVNRVQPYAMVKKLVEQIRQHDFRSLSFDLIYGLPNQDRYTMDATLDKVMQLQPERIACYNYAHLPDRFSSQRAIDRLSLPSAASKLAIQEQIAEKLQAGGYLHIGLDHYVRPDDDLAIAQQQGRLQRNFQGYSVQLADDLLGLGVSAISQMGDYYVQNEHKLDDYYSALGDNRMPLYRGYVMNDEDKLRRHVIMELICNLYLDTADCNSLHGINFESHFADELTTLKAMAEDGLLELDTDSVRITERGRPFLRNICMVFDQYLAPQATAPNAPRYSATV